MHDDGYELVVEVETTAAVVGCAGCGSRARAKDRRWVTVREVPAGDRPVLVRWRKRVWCCPESACEVRTWTEVSDLVGPRRVLTGRALRWATNRIAAIEGTPASIARACGVSWSTVWSGVKALAVEQIDDPQRVGPHGDGGGR